MATVLTGLHRYRLHKAVLGIAIQGVVDAEPFRREWLDGGRRGGTNHIDVDKKGRVLSKSLILKND